MIDSPYFDRLIKKTEVQLNNMIQNESQFDKNAIEVAKYILEERSNCVDYTKYTYADLIDVENHIDKEKYPVRVALLNNEISKRQRSEDYFEKIDIQKRESIVINPRLGVVFKISIGGESFKEITIDDLKDYLITPKPEAFIKIEESSINFLLIFNDNDKEYGFSFEYQDRYSKKNYRSRLHGLSKDFTINFVKDFLERGKSKLTNIEWFETKNESSSFFLFLINTITLIIFLSAVATIFEDNPISLFLSDYQELIQESFIYLLCILSLFNLYITRKQFKNLSKLSNREKVSTLVSLLFPFILIAVLYFWKF